MQSVRHDVYRDAGEAEPSLPANATAAPGVGIGATTTAKEGGDMKKCGHTAPNSAELSPRQRRAITALLQASSVAAASRLAHVPERTLSRWRQDPVFQAAVEAESRRLYRDAGETPYGPRPRER